MSLAMLPHLEIVDRVKNQFPVVDSVLEYANTRYTALKNYNDISKATFVRAESTLQMVVNTIGPVVGRFEQPIHYVDNMAVRGLDTINQKIDSISRTSEEIKTTTVQKIDQTRQRLNSMKNETIDKVQSVLTVSGNVFPLINNIFAAGDYVLDYILPPPEGFKTIPAQESAEFKMSADEKINDFTVIVRALIVRMKRFTERVHERLVIYSREKWFPGLINSVGTFKGNVENLVNSSPKITAEDKELVVMDPSNGHANKQNGQDKKSKKSKNKGVKANPDSAGDHPAPFVDNSYIEELDQQNQQ